MIIYKNSAIGFREDVENNLVVDKIKQEYITKLGRKPPEGEKRAWTNSLRFMETIIRKSAAPDDCGILIEYVIPSTSKRVDFIISGYDKKDNANFVIVELKQWSSAEATDKEDIVKAYVGSRNREVAHPSYQAYSYKKYLSDMNSAIYSGNVKPVSCAYMHNYKKNKNDPLLRPQYLQLVEDTPVFFSEDAKKLEDFVYQYVGQGDGLGILESIENGKIAPSKKFVEYVSEIFEGNDVYTLLDEQKVAYSSIVSLAKNAKKKTTIIVNGGPGTGKSVVAMNALVTILKHKLNVRFVAPNASFRTCLVDNLSKAKKYSKKRLGILFSGSGSYVYSNPNEYDVLICDEAHRLKKKGAYMYKGVSQVEDIIKASKVNVFFVDDNQRIRPDDEGSVHKIVETAHKYDSEIVPVKLKAQFRCSGAEGFLNWVDYTLQIADNANFNGWDIDTFEFSLCNTPQELYEKIKEKNAEGSKARMLAGFAWKWTNEKDGNSDAQVPDVDMPEYNFNMPWNSRSNQYTWATDDSKQNQIGCVHTSQGLEFDYVGVIIGNDLKFDSKNMKVVASFDDYFDTSGKKGLKNDPETLTKLIKNIYKVLLSRGMKGCYVFCRDKKLQEYFRQRLGYLK